MDSNSEVFGLLVAIHSVYFDSDKRALQTGA